jgi:hypothetical protein
MALIFGDLNRALSVKLCYSRYLSSSVVILLTICMTAAFYFYENLPLEGKDASSYLLSSVEIP